MLIKLAVEEQLTSNFIQRATEQYTELDIEQKVKDDRDLRILMFALSTLIMTTPKKRLWRKETVQFNYYDALRAIAYVLSYIKDNETEEV